MAMMPHCCCKVKIKKNPKKVGWISIRIAEFVTFHDLNNMQ